MAKDCLCIHVVFLCNEMWPCQSCQTLISRPSRGSWWPPSSPAAHWLQLLPHIPVFHFWIIVVYNWNIYNLQCKVVINLGSWKLLSLSGAWWLSMNIFYLKKYQVKKSLTFYLVIFKWFSTWPVNFMEYETYQKEKLWKMLDALCRKHRWS